MCGKRRGAPAGTPPSSAQLRSDASTASWQLGSCERTAASHSRMGSADAGSAAASVCRRCGRTAICSGACRLSRLTHQSAELPGAEMMSSWSWWGWGEADLLRRALLRQNRHKLHQRAEPLNVGAAGRQRRQRQRARQRVRRALTERLNERRQRAALWQPRVPHHQRRNAQAQLRHSARGSAWGADARGREGALAT